jgi:hypothetical protein
LKLILYTLYTFNFKNVDVQVTIPYFNILVLDCLTKQDKTQVVNL